jgi:hypothetical protein
VGQEMVDPVLGFYGVAALRSFTAVELRENLNNELRDMPASIHSSAPYPLGVTIPATIISDRTARPRRDGGAGGNVTCLCRLAVHKSGSQKN